MKRTTISAGRILWGAILALLGALMIVDGITFWDLLALIEYWPLLLIAAGLTKLTDVETRRSGIWLVAIGSWLQIMSLGLFGLGWSTAWPLLLVCAGLATLIEGFLTTSLDPGKELNHGR